jgi:hypothetical protein
MDVTFKTSKLRLPIPVLRGLLMPMREAGDCGECEGVVRDWEDDLVFGENRCVFTLQNGYADQSVLYV